LRALEHYLLSLGPDLNPSNCAERLPVSAPPAGRTDEFALRHIQIHTALMSRCAELRSPGRTTEPGRPFSPFG
jgi:hypothetical protein